VGEGDLGLISGASGGVGTVAVQVAIARGAKVIGIASEPNHDYLRSIGATPVAYGEGLGERLREVAPNGVDVFLDASGGDSLPAGVEVVKDKARAITIVDPPKARELGIRFAGSKRSPERLSELTKLWSDGKLQLHVAKTFPLEQAAEAHRQVEPGHARGKVVLTID
jgi:NADPH:quinone reductase-like Zn-dependent oxidoreductase